MNIGILLVIAFGGALITYFLGKISKKARDVFAVFVSITLVIYISFLFGQSFKETFFAGFFDIPLTLSINNFSWLFAIVISAIGSLSIIFSLSYIRRKEKTDFFYLMIQIVNASMLGIVFSGDLLSFYIFWEIMSWSTFLLICYNRGNAINAGMKYIVMSIGGSLAMLVGILSLFSNYGTLIYTEVADSISSAQFEYIIFISILFFIGFGIKNALIPFHVWLPLAHAEAPSPFSAILSGILVKMGAYGFILFIYIIIGIKTFLAIGYGFFSFRNIILILGGITIIIPTFIAIIQDDAKKLLAWSTIGQAGYIIVGITFGTSLSITSGIFHFFNHAIFKTLLFIVVGVVEYRTNGVRDLNSLGGLIKKMPVTFIGALIGVCGLIGVPLTNGFVSKWLIYKTLILEKSPFLAFAALFGTWGTILYSYKLLHNIFFGQLPKKYENIKKAPFNMQLPILILSFAIILFGIIPGIPLNLINSIQISFGLHSLDINIWGIVSDTGTLNLINILTGLFVIGIITWLLTYNKRKSYPINQYDNYAAGSFVPEDKYHYTVNFYDPLNRMLIPFLKDFIDIFYMRLAKSIKSLGNGIRRIYSGDVGHYITYIILFLALLIFIQLKWSIW